MWYAVIHGRSFLSVGTIVDLDFCKEKGYEVREIDWHDDLIWENSDFIRRPRRTPEETRQKQIADLQLEIVDKEARIAELSAIDGIEVESWR
jgi:hypothetical protein